jgi:rod shape-determining protein MreC
VISFKRYRDIILVFPLLALPFFFLRAHIRDPGELGAVDRAVLKISAPVQYAFGAAGRGVTGFFSGYVDLVDTEDDNNRLAHENAGLKGRVRALESAEAENGRLRRLLGLRERLTVETVSAVVSAKDTTEYFRIARLTLDVKGTEVQPDMPVIAVDGAIGTVLRVAGDTVDVQLLVDAGFGVDVVASRTGARGFIRGGGDRSRYAVRVQYVESGDEVEVGDLLVTSGVGCRFPGGIPVARVTKVLRRDFSIHQEVEAEPTVDFSRLQEALIVLTAPKDCKPRRSARR